MRTLAEGGNTLPIGIEQSAQLRQVVAGLSPGQLQWVSGYIAGLASAGAAELPFAAEPTGAVADIGDTLTILYGSQTGNGQQIAEQLAFSARDQGFSVVLESLANVKPAALKREQLVTFVISTHGEGDPPDNAELFHEFILSTRAPKLPNLRYAVLALGDSSYVNFCQTGKELDTRLDELGAERLWPLVECDLDYENTAEAWSDKLLGELPGLLLAESAVPHLRAVQETARYDKHRPFSAEVIVNQKITGATSSKDVRHIELSLEGSGLRYEPGDSLAVIAENPPQLVDQILDELDMAGDANVVVHGQETTIRQALERRLEITAPSLGFLHDWAEYSQSVELADLLQPGREDSLSEFVGGHQIVDIIRKYPAAVGVDEFANSLRKLSHRSYSIASSQSANPDEVHLTVAAVRYDAFGSEHWGSASTLLADRVAEGEAVSVYIESNPGFRLPNDDTPIIMIGAGTGVAPFRSFVEERVERSAAGKNWLIFGDRNFSSDFLYQLEWQRRLKQGHLQALDVAFSRDQDQKVYVQHRIREKASEVCSWIEEGAVIYVCGDAKHMAGDVDDALRDVLVTQTGISSYEAVTQLKELRRDGRYQRDVY